jgi:hypothetical protein
LIPAKSVSAHGTQQRTKNLPRDSNTKELEPQVLDEMH